MIKININLLWIVLITATMMPGSFSNLKLGFGQQNETAEGNVESNKFVNYLENARDLINQSSVEYKSGNFTGAQELVNTAYLDNFEYVEGVLEEKGQNSLMDDLEQMMREDLRKLLQDRADQSEVDMHINATDSKLVEAIELVKDTK